MAPLKVPTCRFARKTSHSIAPHRGRKSGPIANIGSLPFEILSAIFLFVRAAVVPELDWVRVGWVCSYWRQVALATNLLWTQLSFHRPCDLDLVSGLLARSSSSHLHLQVNTAFFNAEDICRILIQQSPRLRSLSITFHPDQTAWISHSLDSCKPVLRSLMVRALQTEAQDGHDGGSLIRITASPFSVPNLRSLHVANVHVLFPPFIIEKLESLTIADFTRVPIEWESGYLRDLLVHCAPALRRLVIDDPTYFIPHLPEPISFPKLQELKIRACYMCNLLPYMRFPATARVNIVYIEEGLESWSTSTDVFTDLVLLNEDDPLRLDRCFPMLSQTRRLVIQAGINIYWSGFIGDEERAAWKTSTDLGRPPIQVTLRMLGPMMRNAYRVLDADALEELECHLAPHIDPYEHWPSLIHRFRKLKKFTFGPTRSVMGLIPEFAGVTRNIPSLEELVVCVPEVADELVRKLAECKKAKHRQGVAILPPIVVFRLPTRLAGDLQTRSKLAHLRDSMVRLTKIGVEYRDCSFCHRTPKSGHPIKLVWDRIELAWVPPPPRVS
ncbi:hypothetical protein C8Q70DRAFT_43679 [Cubamyces menziesii]|nr:hypothetical protein C8Q70DRAFT_43679 [Cubamyces menziesii]